MNPQPKRLLSKREKAEEIKQFQEDDNVRIRDFDENFIPPKAHAVKNLDLYLKIRERKVYYFVKDVAFINFIRRKVIFLCFIPQYLT